MQEALFTLIRLGLETETPSKEGLRTIASLCGREWTQLGVLAEKQGVLGIVMDGIERCHTDYTDSTANLPLELKLEWIGETLQIEQSNQQQIAVMNDLAEKWSQKGCRVMVMKGQANGAFYPRPNHRSPGDIDCYLFDDYAKGNVIARQVGADVDESWYKHSVINYKRETFENHQYFVHTRDGKRGKRLNQELVDAVIGERFTVMEGTNVLMPPVQWNAMFLTYHACSHFVSEGLRLKQILDWAMFLKSHQNDVNWPEFYAFCERNHLRRFADAMTAIAVNYLGIKVTQNSQITTESPYAEKILHNTLYEDDYVFSSGESGWKNRWHIVTNLFKYRWKYKDVYEMSIYKQLWFYITGFIFKTE